MNTISKNDAPDVECGELGDGETGVNLTRHLVGEMPEQSKIELVQFRTDFIRPADENAYIYNGFFLANDDDRGLVEDIRRNGILTPLTISTDGVLLSGHRRHAAARMLRMETVPVHVHPVVFEAMEMDARFKLLRSFNQQRDKTFEEATAEALLSVDAEEASDAALIYRIERERIKVAPNVIMGKKVERAEITTRAFLDAVVKIVNGYRNEWGISNRAIHYDLLNDPPLTHDQKPKSHYQNLKPFTAKLSSLLTRARIAGLIPMEAICDEERPVTLWDVHPNASAFVAKQHETFLMGYGRDLMQSQPHHIEIIVEKRTKYAAARAVAMKYTIPVTAGKGYASLAPRYQIAKRYQESGKDKLILIFMTDFDPDGEQIAISFARSMRDDFEIYNVVPYKAGLTAEQVRTLNLPSSLEAKPKSPNYKRFVAKHGTRAVELDAMPSDVFARVLTDAIESFLDVEAFNHEVEQQRQEHQWLAARRKAALQAMGGGAGQEGVAE